MNCSDFRRHIQSTKVTWLGHEYWRFLSWLLRVKCYQSSAFPDARGSHLVGEIVRAEMLFYRCFNVRLRLCLTVASYSRVQVS